MLEDMEIEAVPTRVSTSSSLSSSSGSSGGCRPNTAPVNAVSHATNPPRAIHTAPTPTNATNDAQNVRVVARVRPLSTKELNERSSESITAHSRQNTINVDEGGHDANDKRKFEFDAVFGTSSTQEEVYDKTCGDMISSSIFKGFNATILAYGQTGSGKTFTMGTDGSTGGGSLNNEEAMAPPSQSEGVIFRAVYDLFQAKNSLPNGSDRVKVTMSYLEIYNEQAIDLLNDDPSSANATLQVRDSKTEGVVIPNLKHFDVASPSEVSALMEKASLKRATASTHMNSVSSRSHAICTLNVTIAPSDGLEEDDGEDIDLISPRSTASSASTNDHGMRAKLTLVDLAGSERIKRTGASGDRMKEGININKGLFVLGQVVSALSELGQRSHGGSTHIPYRDSKLTRLLQDSLGGNSRTVMIACISPADSNIEESTNTLRYAERTRNIKNSAVRNVVSSGLSASEAAALRRENQQLKLELARMESRMIVSNNNNGRSAGSLSGAAFSFGGMISAENMETVSQLQAQCTSLLAEIDLLKGRAKGHTGEVLEASLRADKWQAKFEALAKLAQSQGVDLSEVEDDSDGNGIISQLRSELAECKAELLESRTEAIVARATAGAIIAGKGDLDNMDDIVASGEDSLNQLASADDDDNAHNEHLATELSEVSATIEQKEAMVLQMNKERACMDNLQMHFENSFRLLQTEMDAVTAERDGLVVKMSHSEKETNGNAKQRGKRKANDPMTKRLRDQISKLEERIGELKCKANEHKRSMKMKEEAERKVQRLTDDIADDKRRRADLQRKLKETSVEMREEKKAARQKAAKMFKDSQKLKIELMKMKSAAQKQAAVLKRKIDQASAKEKARAEHERKRRSAEKMRLASSSMDNSDVKESRKIELSSWIDREFEFSLIKYHVDTQRRQLDKAMSARKRLAKNDGDAVNAQELGQMDKAIRSLRSTVQDLETTLKKAFPMAADGSLNSAFRFLETDTFKALTKPDAKYVLSYIFDTCSSAKQEMASTVLNQEAAIKSSVDSALAKEQQLHEKELTKIKMGHAKATLNLLESTQDTVNSNIKLKVDSDMEDEEAKAQVDEIVGAYSETWSATTEALKSDVDEIMEAQEDLQQMMDDIAKGMAMPPKKPKAKKKSIVDYDEEAFESEESFMEEEEVDSDYAPTPAKAKKSKTRRSPRLAKKAAPGSPASPLGEHYLGEIENKKVQSLKKACKKLGVPQTGKKAELQQRVREHILSTSVAVTNPTEDERAVGPFMSSAMKKVIFHGDVAVDPEFQPIDENPSPTIKKKLWQDVEEDVVPAKQSKSSSPSSKLPPKTPSKTTPCKRKKRSPSFEKGSADKENNNAHTPKKLKPLAFGSSSPRPLTSHNAKSAVRTPVHLKQTIATSKKRLVPSVKASTAITKRNITASTKKRKERTKRGMGDAVARALQQNGDLV